MDPQEMGLAGRDPFREVRSGHTSPSCGDAPTIKSEPGLEPVSTFGLHELVASQSPGLLEDAVREGAHVLESLADILANLPPQIGSQTSHWLQAIRELLPRAAPTRTVVGVVGRTGAGKSSVINALLDEERLLPTNCIRACTASATEISFNYSDDPAELYRAEVEFISAEEWASELGVLFHDLIDGNGKVSRDCNNAETEAGTAYAKIKAVYPSKTKEVLAKSDPTLLAREPMVQSVLGTTKSLRESSASTLYQTLQQYVDSKEKNSKKQMEYWPLVKVVRIYTKAAALSTGAVIVDLPGVQDSNAARAAIAEKYMKACTALWIVAPITRAVDDKTAKSLLGDSFRRQLKYDGIYSAVTFICSKTDDISTVEAASSLNLEHQIAEYSAQRRELSVKISRCEDEVADLESQRSSCNELFEECDAKYDLWEDISERLASGKTVYPPPEDTRKRKRSSTPVGDGPAGTSATFQESQADSETDCRRSDAGRPMLTEEKVNQMLASLRTRKRAARNNRMAFDSKIVGLQNEIYTCRVENKRVELEFKALCIRGRNAYSRDAIRMDFAMGIKELDQETAIEENEAAFNPDEESRDYEQVAHSLAVYCVSSRAYQKLCGRLDQEDFQSHGLPGLEDTEIPQLQEHTRKLTEAGRASNCRSFLNDLGQILNSMRLWATVDSSSASKSEAEKHEAEHSLQVNLTNLKKGLNIAIQDCIKSMEHILSANIFDPFNGLIPAASSVAVSTAGQWGANRSDGGLWFQTYKAVCHRQGVFPQASGGPQEFNAALFEPISSGLASNWERTFQRLLPSNLDAFSTTSAALLRSFHAAATELNRHGHLSTSLNMLSDQVGGYVRSITNIVVATRTRMNELQRNANREFAPVIAAAMASAYVACVQEAGPGSYMRMKAIMADHVDTARHSMFRQAADAGKNLLGRMCVILGGEMHAHVGELFNKIARDYTTALIGALTVASQTEIIHKARMAKLLEGADEKFTSIIGRPIE